MSTHLATHGEARLSLQLPHSFKRFLLESPLAAKIQGDHDGHIQSLSRAVPWTTREDVWPRTPRTALLRVTAVLDRIAGYFKSTKCDDMINLLLTHETFFQPVARSLWEAPDDIMDLFSLLPPSVLKTELSVSGHHVLKFLATSFHPQEWEDMLYHARHVFHLTADAVATVSIKESSKAAVYGSQPDICIFPRLRSISARIEYAGEANMLELFINPSLSHLTVQGDASVSRAVNTGFDAALARSKIVGTEYETLDLELDSIAPRKEHLLAALASQRLRCFSWRGPVSRRSKRQGYSSMEILDVLAEKAIEELKFLPIPSPAEMRDPKLNTLQGKPYYQTGFHGLFKADISHIHLYRCITPSTSGTLISISILFCSSSPHTDAAAMLNHIAQHCPVLESFAIITDVKTRRGPLPVGDFPLLLLANLTNLKEIEVVDRCQVFAPPNPDLLSKVPKTWQSLKVLVWKCKIWEANERKRFIWPGISSVTHLAKLDEVHIPLDVGLLPDAETGAIQYRTSSSLTLDFVGILESAEVMDRELAVLSIARMLLWAVPEGVEPDAWLKKPEGELLGISQRFWMDVLRAIPTFW